MSGTSSRDAFQQAVKLLAGRERTAASLRAGLERRGYSGAEIDEALNRVKDLGYLDDLRSAARQARSGLSAGRAPADVRARLVASGIDDLVAVAAVDAAMAEVGYDEVEVARTLLASRGFSGALAARFLASRGFAEAVIESLVGAE